jgi:hypothetical protein
MTVGNEAELVMVVRRKLSYETPEQLSEVLDNLTNRAMRDKVDAIGTFIYPTEADEPKNSDYESVKFYAILNGNKNGDK